ncbi:hypothetical protein CYLTODRAFT_190897 [Cylindrobasidium torrendii FP15055 ss-10]|uniref:Uncharacterized protein n=1 Tax=Cylindrobasidium torrendii FP15055 ss-10 TaxID=1314674 RepID=A0A0D7BT35_9AGAR|nr:hypothetical protein CYLTODRAFT_190897 [Cylindrobasidium torrendii FP15055 ss-10]
MRVIFRDEAGNEITRVGDFTPGGEKKRAAPIVVQDEDGKVLYRHGHPPPETPSDTDSDSTCPHCRHHCRHRRAASPHRTDSRPSSKKSRIRYPPEEKAQIVLIDGSGKLVPIRQSEYDASTIRSVHTPRS